MIRQIYLFFSKNRSFFTSLFIFVTDLIIFYIGLFIAYSIRLKLSHLFPSLPEFKYSISYLLSLFYIPAFYILSQLQLKNYKLSLSLMEDLLKILKALCMSLILLLLFVALFKKQDEISRLFIFSHYMILIILLSTSRITMHRMLNKGILKKKIIFLGLNDDLTQRFLESLQKSSSYAGDIKTFYLDGLIDRYHDHLKLLQRGLPQVEVGVLILDRRAFNLPTFSLFLSKLRPYVEEILLFDPNLDFALLQAEPLYFHESQFLTLRFQGGLILRFNETVKRVIDLLLFIVCLPPLLFLFLLFFVLIKIESRGPVIYKQRRIGRDGKAFYLYKFRTMHVNADAILIDYLSKNPELKKEWEQFRKLKDDPRVTKLGRFLRRFSLDELPQIINILKGDMSFVGPRPVTQEELDLYYREYAELYKSVKPGLTGLWQVSGRNELDYETRVSLDVYYILNWNISLDLYIIFKTPYVLVSGKGAY